MSNAADKDYAAICRNIANLGPELREAADRLDWLAEQLCKALGRIEDKNAKIEAAFHLLLEARDAWLRGVSPSLADRIEDWLKAWQVAGEGR